MHALIVVALVALPSMALASGKDPVSPASDRCLSQLTSDSVRSRPTSIESFLSEIEFLRQGPGTPKERHAALSDLLQQSEFMQVLTPGIQWEFARRLADPRRAQLSARKILDRLLKNDFKKWQDSDFFRPVISSLAHWESHFSVQRIVRMPVAADLAEAILNGVKTLTVRLGNHWTAKSGKGLFVVTGSGQEIPVIIDKVVFRVRSAELAEEAMLRRQGPNITDVLKADGVEAAVGALLKSLRRFYPAENLSDAEFTVIYFKRILH